MSRAMILTAAAIVALSALGAIAADQSAHERLGQALTYRHDLDVAQHLHLVAREGDHELSERDLDVAAKRFGSELRTIARFTEPAHLRGTTILLVEPAQGSSDLFVYVPAQRRARRVGTARRSDSFAGTDLLYEDLERHRAEDFEVEDGGEIALAGEPARIVSARPQRESIADRVEFIVAESDAAILEVRQFHAYDRRPFRVLEMPRAHVRMVAGRPLPTRLWVRNLERGTETEVRIDPIQVDPPLDERWDPLESTCRHASLSIL